MQHIIEVKITLKLQTTTDPSIIHLYKKKVAPNKKRKTGNYFKAYEGLRKVRKGGFGFQIEGATSSKIIDVNCDSGLKNRVSARTTA